MPGRRNTPQDHRAFPHLWMETLCTGSVPKMLELYLPNAVLVATYNKDVLQGKPRLAAYFRTFMQKKGLCGQIDGIVPQRLGRSGIFSGLYTFRWRERGNPKTVQARFTYVVVPTRAGPRILTHHSSEVPD